MTHLSGYCTCGRRKHYPKNAALGSTWTCYRCGRNWVLSTRGKPLFVHRSKPPRKSGKEKTGCNPVMLLLAGGVWLGSMMVDLVLTVERLMSRG